MPQGVAPSFLTKPAVQQNGKISTIVLEVAADPSPSVNWTKDGKELLNVDKTQTRIEKKGSNQYTIFLDIKVK